MPTPSPRASRDRSIAPVKRFRGGLVFKAHRLVYHSTQGLRVIKKKRSLEVGGVFTDDTLCVWNVANARARAVCPPGHPEPSATARSPLRGRGGGQFLMSEVPLYLAHTRRWVAGWASLNWICLVPGRGHDQGGEVPLEPEISQLSWDNSLHVGEVSGGEKML